MLSKYYLSESFTFNITPILIFLIVDLLFDRSYACHLKMTFKFQYVLTMPIVRFFPLLSRGKVVWILWLPHYY
jgi:hypothetical protein